MNDADVKNFMGEINDDIVYQMNDITKSKSFYEMLTNYFITYGMFISIETFRKVFERNNSFDMQYHIGILRHWILETILCKIHEENWIDNEENFRKQFEENEAMLERIKEANEGEGTYDRPDAD